MARLGDNKLSSPFFTGSLLAASSVTLETTILTVFVTVMFFILGSKSMVRMTLSERRLRSRLHTTFGQTRKHAHLAVDARRCCQELEQQRRQLGCDNPGLATVGRSQRIQHYWLLVGLVAVYAVDLVLCSAIVDCLPQKDLLASPWLGPLFRFLIPTALLLIEMALSIQHCSPRRAVDNHNCLLGRTAAVLCNVACPLVSIGIFANVSADGLLSWASFLLLTVLAGLSLILHLLALSAGPSISESASYLAYRLTRSDLADRIQQKQRVYVSESRQAADSFKAYMQTYMQVQNSGHETFPNATVTAGLFDKDAVDVVNQIGRASCTERV